MRKRMIWLLLIISLSACSDSNAPSGSEQVSTPMDQQESTEAPSSSEEVDFLTGDKFDEASDFQINQFDLSYSEADHAILYQISYRFGAEPTQFITQGNHPYYFRLTAPEDLSESFVSSSSEPVQGSALNGNTDDAYQVTLQLDLKDQEDPNQVQELLNKPQNYVLYLYENEDFPARIIGNVYGWMQQK